MVDEQRTGRAAKRQRTAAMPALNPYDAMRLCGRQTVGRAAGGSASGGTDGHVLCPLCAKARPFARGRGLRMHLLGKHSGDDGRRGSGKKHPQTEQAVALSAERVVELMLQADERPVFPPGTAVLLDVALAPDDAPAASVSAAGTAGASSTISSNSSNSASSASNTPLPPAAAASAAAASAP